MKLDNKIKRGNIQNKCEMCWIWQPLKSSTINFCSERNNKSIHTRLQYFPYTSCHHKSFGYIIPLYNTKCKLNLFHSTCVTLKVEVVKNSRSSKSSLRMFSLNCFITTSNFILMRCKVPEKMKLTSFALSWPCDPQARSRSVNLV